MAQRDWVLEHIQKYRESDGEDGHTWRGVDGKQNLPCLLLTTTGRRSGKTYTTPLIYGQDGDRYVIIASRGGTANHPMWYQNLVAEPEVDLQVGAERFAATARTAASEERATLWQLMASIFPTYNDYQEKAKASREIPVVVLERP